MSKTAKILMVGLLMLAFGTGTAFGFVDHVVDDDGNPATDFPDLTTALATVGTFAGTDHRIIIRAGSYSDANLTVPNNIIAIIGDDPSTVIFTGDSTQHFLNTGGAQSGFSLSGITVAGYLDGIRDQGGASHTYTGNIFMANNRGVVLWGSSSGISVTANCFIGNTTAQGYDDDGGSNTWSGNYYDDFTFPLPYLISGAGGEKDWTPQTYDNSPVGPSTVEVLNQIDVDFDWSVPACDAADPHALAGYQFTVSWDPTKLSYVGGSAGYDEGYLGTTGDGALYTPISVDAGAGTMTFAAANFSAPGSGDARLAFASFEGIATGASSITISSDYRDPDNNPLVVSSSPLSVTVTDTQAPTITSLTPNNPVGDDTYSDGSVAGAGPFVELWVDVQAADNFNLNRIQYRFNGAGAWINLVTGLSGTADGTTDTVYVDITALGEGANVLDVRARDASGNYSAESHYNFTIDRTGPVLTSIMLADADGCAANAEYTNDPGVTANFVDDGTAVQMEFYDADVPGWQGPIAYANPNTYSMKDSTDGAKTVYARLYDAYGNMGNQTSDGITLDQVAPSPSGFLLAGGAAKTNTTSINSDANEDVAGGTVEVAVSENSGDLTCGGAATWLAAPVHPIPITLSAGDGVKTVYFAARDAAGNISTLLSDDIELDETAPNVASCAAVDANGDACSDSWTIQVDVSWTDPDVKYVHIYDTSGTPGALTVDLTALTSPAAITYTIGAGGYCDDYNGIFVYFEDDIGNTGDTCSSAIFVDCGAPSIAGIEMSDQATSGTVWSTSATVDVTLTGFDTDIVQVAMGEVSGVYTDTVPFDPNDPVVAFTFGAPTTTDWVYLIGMDCAGRVTGEVSDAMKFDLIDPVISNVDINSGAAKTNTTAVSVNFSVTEANPLTIEMSENPAVDGSDPTYVSMSWSGGPPKPFTLSSGDGVKTVYVRLTDKSGRTSTVESDDIELDETLPAVLTATLQADPALQPTALAGYTASLTDNEVVGITGDADVVFMQLWNGAFNTGWIALASSYNPVTLTAGADGVRTVNIRFQDDIGNVGPTTTLSIMYDTSPPAAPSWASGSPGGSLDMAWGPVADAQMYMLRYNFAGDYPLYTNPNPPAPANMGQGFDGGSTADTTFVFAGPQPDIYAISIWSVDSAGNVSASPNTDVYNSNYVPGDFTGQSGLPDGCIDFADEFGALAVAYNSVSADPNFNDSLDIHPFGLNNTPDPDGDIDFDDLIAFAINYDQFRCGTAAEQGGRGYIGIGKPIAEAVNLTAEVPVFMEPNREYTISLRVSDPGSVKGYHLVFDYDHDMVDIVDIKAGQAFSTVDQSFFYVDRKAANVDITGVVFGADAEFTDNEIATVTIRSKASGRLMFSDDLLDVRDHEGQPIDVAFSLNGSTNPGMLPTSFSLSQNYPNPFNPTTTIQLALPTASNYRLTIYNIAGQVVDEFSGYSEAGYVTIDWDASRLASGIYLYRVVAGSFTATKKMVLLK